MKDKLRQWKHIFKLDPDRSISDQALQSLCLSGTDAIMVGGSSGVTYDNTVELLSRIRRYTVPCMLELSNQEAIVPGFDLYFIPFVLNASDTKWIIRLQQQAIRKYGAMIDWERIVAEAYVILNANSTVAKLTGVDTQIDEKDVVAYARMADRLLHFPIFYMEYSGVYGDMSLVKRTAAHLEHAQLFYGGGIDSGERAKEAAAAADTIIVGNVIYDNLQHALDTVRALQ